MILTFPELGDVEAPAETTGTKWNLCLFVCLFVYSLSEGFGNTAQDPETRLIGAIGAGVMRHFETQSHP